MSRALLAGLGFLSIWGYGLQAHGQAPLGPVAPAPAPSATQQTPVNYSDLGAVKKQVGNYFPTVRDVVEGLRAAARECDRPRFQEQRAGILSAISNEQRKLKAATVSGPDAAKIQEHIENANAALELMKADIPTFEACREPVSAPQPPQPTSTGPQAPAAKPLDPEHEADMDEILEALGRRPVMAALPPELVRPPLQPTTALVVPDRFCSELDRNAYLAEVYNPAASEANAYAQAATAYQGRVTELANARMRAGEGEVWGALLAERKAYQMEMDGALAHSRHIVALYPTILQVPIGECPKLTQRPPISLASAPAPQPVKTAAARGASAPDDCPPGQTRKPIIVGPNARVGSGARLRAKVASTALGIAGNLLGAPKLPMGGGGGGGGPPMVNCRIKDSEMTVFQDGATGTALKVGAKQTGDTLVVFAKIDRSSDNGTFQTAFLQRPNGQVLAPANVGICDLWGEWKLTVSWTRETYVDNQLVSRESGGWSEGGRFALPGMMSTSDRPDGMWRRLGFSNASHGARMVALQFKVPAAQAAAGPMDLVVHVTQPAADPVITTPFALRMSSLAGGGFGFAEAPAVGCPPGGGIMVASNPELEPTRVANNTPGGTGPTIARTPGGTGPSIPRPPGGGATEGGYTTPPPVPVGNDTGGPEVGVCGPDVTAAYVHELAIAWMRLSRLSDDEKGLFDGTAFLKRNGMNVDLTPAGIRDQCPLGPCAGKNDTKQPCFTLFGACIPRHVFNDLLFGLMGKGVGVPVTIQQLGGHWADQTNYDHWDAEASQKAYAAGSAFGELFGAGATTLTPEAVQALPAWTELLAQIRKDYPFTLQCAPCPDPAPGRMLKSYARSNWKLEDGTFDEFNTKLLRPPGSPVDEGE